MKELTKFEFEGETLVVYTSRYTHDDAVAIGIITEFGEPYASFSKNLRSYGAKIEDDEFHVDTNNMPKGLVRRMYETGLFRTTLQVDKSGFCWYPVWKIVDPLNVPKKE